MVLFLLNLEEFFTSQRYEPIDCELHCKYFLNLSIAFGFVCSFPQGKVLFCFHFYMATLINLFFYVTWILSHRKSFPTPRSKRHSFTCVITHMVSIFTCRPLICLIYLLYAVKYESNFIFFQMVNKLSCNLFKKVYLPISGLFYSTGLTSLF